MSQDDILNTGVFKIDVFRQLESLRKEKIIISGIIIIPPPRATGFLWLDLKLGLSTNFHLKNIFFAMTRLMAVIKAKLNAFSKASPLLKKP